MTVFSWNIYLGGLNIAIGQKRPSDVQEKRPRIAGVLPFGAPDYKSAAEIIKINNLGNFLLRNKDL